MVIDREQRARKNRDNARHSTGPNTPEGKAASRLNALKHGLTSRITPITAPGEEPGMYQARLDVWMNDLKPQNVLEMTMLQRACRASWKLERCDRYEDAAAAKRSVRDPEIDSGVDSVTAAGQADVLGKFLMYAVSFPHAYSLRGALEDIVKYPDKYDNAPRDVDALGRFKEGVEWLLNSWAEVLPHLPRDDRPPDPNLTLHVIEVMYWPPDTEPVIDEAKALVERMERRALRLLGVATGTTPPSQPLWEAGEAEVRRLTKRLEELSGQPFARLDADLALFGAGPEMQLLHRYATSAERELHRAVDTFMKLRKNPELFESSDLEETIPSSEPAEPVAVEEPVAEPRRDRQRVPRTMPPERNEANRDERLNPNFAPTTTPEESGSGSEGAF